MEYPGEEDTVEETDPLMSSLAMLSSRQEARERDATNVDFEDDNVEKIETKKPEVLETTLRVSNLSKSVTEGDLNELFRPFGKITKLSLPKTLLADGKREVRGFAYVSFEDRSSVEKAIALLDGRGYDHLILKLELAKPALGGGGGGGGSGLSSGFVSGYGKQLAQDTTEKAVFTSHGNSNPNRS